MTKWRVPFAGGFSAEGEIDSSGIGGNNWTGYNRGADFGNPRVGAIIQTGGPMATGVIDSFTPSVGWGWKEIVATGDGGPTYLPSDFSRQRLALMGDRARHHEFPDVGFRGSWQGMTPDLTALAAYHPTLVPAKVRIYGLRLALHVRGGLWGDMPETAIVSTPSPSNPSFDYLHVGQMPAAIGVEHFRTRILVVAADAVDENGVAGVNFVLSNVVILKTLIYDGDTGNVVADRANDVNGRSSPPGTLPHDSGTFYWGYESFQQLHATGGDREGLVSNRYNMVPSWSDPAHESTEPFRSSTNAGESDPDTDVDPPGPPPPPGSPTDEELEALSGLLYWTGADGVEEDYQRSPVWLEASFDGITHEFSPAIYDIDLELDYSKVAGRSIFLVYPATIPWGDDFWIGMDAVANSDAAYSAALSTSAGQVEIDLPRPGAKGVSADPNPSYTLTRVLALKADYWIPACCMQPSGVSTSPIGGNVYYGPGAPWIAGSPTERGNVTDVLLQGDGPQPTSGDPRAAPVMFAWTEVVGPGIDGIAIDYTTSTQGDTDWKKPWLGHSESEFPVSYSTPTQSSIHPLAGKTYYFRLCFKYRALDDDLVAWDYSLWYEQAQGRADYPWHWETIEGEWMPFEWPPIPVSTVFPGPQDQGLVRAHRNMGITQG